MVILNVSVRLQHLNEYIVPGRGTASAFAHTPARSRSSAGRPSTYEYYRLSSTNLLLLLHQFPIPECVKQAYNDLRRATGSLEPLHVAVEFIKAICCKNNKSRYDQDYVG